MSFNRLRSIRLIGFFIVGGMGVGAMVGHAQIVANFTGGTGTTQPDQYTGAAGGGWSGGWSATTNTSGSVSSATPLDGGGNYLSVALTSSAVSGSVRRQYTSGSGVSIATTYRISFDWRFDGNKSAMTVFEDRIQFFGDTSAVAGSATTNTWLIGWAAADGTNNDIHGGSWYFFDRNVSSDFTVANMFNTGMGLDAGTVYSFTVDVNPVAGTYSATISNGLTSVSATELGFRRGAVNVSASPAHLGFGVNRSTTSDNVTFALDSLSITAVPEPAGAAAIAGLAVFCGVVTARRRRASQG